MIGYLKDNALLILGVISIAFLIIFGLYRIFSNAKGSWSARLKAPIPPRAAFEAKMDHKPARESEGERRTRAFLERYFQKPFPKIRPAFLNNDVTGGKYNLEIDCFNEELRLGVEYNGRQHYEYVPFFHTSKEAFYNQKYRDKLKGIYCKDSGVTLIEVPYTELDNLESWLEKELRLRIPSRA
jgi:hypothetical protein